ncbi:MAG: hypothetical protein DMF78_01540 [Acidobacteria bacterium]|nr:MAG: hypothetical protein DMF78_01540 [Acidobacteriota bacterium]
MSDPTGSGPLDDDPLSRARVRVMYALSILTLVFLVPFAVYDLMRGRVALGISVLVVVGAFLVDGYAVRHLRPPPIPYALLLVPIAAAIAMSLAQLGVIGAFWCYPVVLFFYFVLPRWQALACSLALLLMGTVMVHRYLSMRITIRFAVSLILTIVIVDIILQIVHELERRLMEQAIRDPLTGAFNRRHMELRLAEAPEGYRRHGSPSAILILDVDHFKRINDTLGHKAGDVVLKGIVTAVRSRARKLDLVFRMGGEEFLVLMPQTTEMDAAAVAEEIRQAIAVSPLLDGRKVTVSIGVGGLRGDDSVDAWVRDTDAAMYAAKEAGRNRVERRAPASAAAR